MIEKKKIIWISWEQHRRTQGLCEFLGIQLVIFDKHFPLFLRYAYNCAVSWIFIHKVKPSILFVQNPSIVLTILSCFLKPIYRYMLIVDAHNVALIPENKYLEKLLFIFKFMQRKSDITIVTNKALADIVFENGGKPFILPDHIPNYPEVNKTSLSGIYKIAYICTFKDDEPFRELVNAAKYFNNDVYFYVTGDSNKCPKDIIMNLPQNVILTGYLEEKQYWSLLTSVDIIIDLTYRENCLVCGAYEAVAVGKPMVLSQTNTLNSYFYKGVCFTNNEAKTIYESISNIISDYERFLHDVKNLKIELLREWTVYGEKLKRLIGISQ